METSKLEFKDVAGYMPYVLLGKSMSGSVQPITLGIRQVNQTVSIILDEELKPILRPLSDLYKSITHNGKEIVPIVECFKKILVGGEIIPDNYSAYDSVSRNWLSLDCSNNFIIQYMLSGHKVYDNISTIANLALFDYLHELKIDYRGLIDTGLAIDVNTLSVNPYK